MSKPTGNGSGGGKTNSFTSGGGGTIPKQIFTSSPYGYTTAGGSTAKGHPNKKVATGTNGGSQSYTGQSPKFTSGGSGSIKPSSTKSAPRVVDTPDNSAGGTGTVKQPDITSIYDSLAPMKLPSLPSKTLQNYIDEATKDLGKGTDYTALMNQVKSDTSRSDKNIADMYSALQSGIRAQDPILKSAYESAQASTKANGTQAQNSINAAYDAARKNTAARLAAVGAPAGAGLDTGSFADQDQANSISSSANTAQSAVTSLLNRESSARQANSERATNAGFTGAQMRGDLQQGLADNLAKIHVQQSQEDASRRAQALQFAQGLRSNDIAAYQAQVGASQAQFGQGLDLLKAKEGELVDTRTAQQAATNSGNSLAEYMASLGLDPVTGAPTALAQQKQTQSKLSTYAQLLRAANGTAGALPPQVLSLLGLG